MFTADAPSAQAVIHVDDPGPRESDTKRRRQPGKLANNVPNPPCDTCRLHLYCATTGQSCPQFNFYVWRGKIDLTKPRTPEPRAHAPEEETE